MIILGPIFPTGIVTGEGGKAGGLEATFPSPPTVAIGHLVIFVSMYSSKSTWLGGKKIVTDADVK
jgi:hypothetical protein